MHKLCFIILVLAFGLVLVADEPAPYGLKDPAAIVALQRYQRAATQARETAIDTLKAAEMRVKDPEELSRLRDLVTAINALPILPSPQSATTVPAGAETALFSSPSGDKALAGDWTVGNLGVWTIAVTGHQVSLLEQKTGAHSLAWVHYDGSFLFSWSNNNDLIVVTPAGDQLDFQCYQKAVTPKLNGLPDGPPIWDKMGIRVTDQAPTAAR